MLCQMCGDNLGNVSIRYNHHNSPQSFYNAIRAECFICRNVWQKIVEISDAACYESGDWVPRTYEDFVSRLRPHLPEQDEFWSFAAKRNPPDPHGLPFSVVRNESRRHNTRALEFAVKLRHDLVQIAFRRAQDDHRAEMRPSEEPSPVGSAWSTSQKPELWNQWLRVCSETHSRCRIMRDGRQFSPSRLVEIVVADDKPTGWRIVEQTADDPRPEACEVATSLGFPHIWIDVTLCIIQDDIADWEKESAVMGRIYEGAVVNIAATWAADGSLGLYHGRDPATVSAPDLGEGKTTLTGLRMYTDDIEEAPLNTRAWVSQERYLAPGQLSFTKNQVYWECQELMACEQFPGGMPGESWNRKLMAGFLGNYRTLVPPVGKPTVDFGDIPNLNEAWGAMVKAYSACYLTKGSDKLVALVGLAGKARETLSDTYLAGMWRKELLSQLCWNTYPQYERAVSRIKGCWVPTWSWASLDGPIDPDLGFGPRPGYVIVNLAQVLDVQVATDHPSGLYKFTQCGLSLRAVFVQGKLSSPHGKSSIHEPDLVFEPLTPSPIVGDSGAYLGTSVYWDEFITGSTVKSNIDATKHFRGQGEEILFFAIISAQLGGDHYSLWGLVLRMVGEGITSRLGMFEFSVHQGSRYLQEILLGKAGLPQDHNASAVELPKVRFGDLAMAGFVQDITIV